MYEVCMSAERRVEPTFESNAPAWEGPAPVSLGSDDLIYQEDTSNSFSGLLIKSGLVVLLAISTFAGYQFFKGSGETKQIAHITPQEVDNTDQKKIRKIDLTTTASISKPESRLGKPVPIDAAKPQNSGKLFHVVQSGDTLSAIGKKFKIKTTELMEMNGIEDARRLKLGMKLIVSK